MLQAICQSPLISYACRAVTPWIRHSPILTTLAVTALIGTAFFLIGNPFQCGPCKEYRTERLFRVIHGIESPYSSKKALTLVAKGVDPNAISRSGYPILSEAVLLGDRMLVKALLDTGAQPNPKDPFPPLTLAVDGNETAIVRLLIKQGARVNAAPGISGPLLNTALMNQNPGMFLDLIHAGARQVGQDFEGLHTRQRVRKANRKEIEEAYAMMNVAKAWSLIDILSQT